MHLNKKTFSSDVTPAVRSYPVLRYRSLLSKKFTTLLVSLSINYNSRRYFRTAYFDVLPHLELLKVPLELGDVGAVSPVQSRIWDVILVESCMGEVTIQHKHKKYDNNDRNIEEP